MTHFVSKSRKTAQSLFLTAAAALASGCAVTPSASSGGYGNPQGNEAKLASCVFKKMADFCEDAYATFAHDKASYPNVKTRDDLGLDLDHYYNRVEKECTAELFGNNPHAINDDVYARELGKRGPAHERKMDQIFKREFGL